MRQNGSSLQAIADELNRLREEEAALKGEATFAKKIAASTISRELKRNRNRNKRGGYSPGLAKNISKERIYQEIRANLDKYSKFTHHGMKYRRHQAKPYKTAGKSMIPDRKTR